MCDTIVALGNATSDGSVLFAKNSDREPDEVQNLEVIEAAEHAAGAKVKCTFIEIPQAGHTNRVLLCRPFWMFGAEMGANEHGVAIGNEAIFTKVKPADTGLTGMDLLRLALERSDSAAGARDTIIALLEEHGQGGNCGYRHKIKYMNSFIIADQSEAYVLETVAKWWAWKKIEETWSISNIISLTDDFDKCSPGLIDNAVKKGWCKSESDFNFRQCYSDLIYTHFAFGEPRQSRSRELLEANKGRLDTRTMMSILRDHGSFRDWRPDRQKKCTVCMHAANPLTRPSQSVCSLVAKLGKDDRFYSTGAPSPCMSPFFPVFGKDAGLPTGYKPGGENYDAESHWWMSERLHRKALSRFEPAVAAAGALYAKYEELMVERLEKCCDMLDRTAMDNFFREACEAVKSWGEKMERLPEQKIGPLYKWYWDRYNRIDKVG